MWTDFQPAIKKSELLFSAGYRYNLERELYVNRNTRTAFSIDFVEDSDEQEIRRRLVQPPPASGWRFHFARDPSHAVQKELESLLTNGRSNH